MFDQLSTSKRFIEESYGNSLEWQRLDNKKSCRIKHSYSVDGYNEENWDEMIEWLVNQFPKFEAAFEPHIEVLKRTK